MNGIEVHLYVATVQCATLSSAAGTCGIYRVSDLIRATLGKSARSIFNNTTYLLYLQCPVVRLVYCNPSTSVLYVSDLPIVNNSCI